MAWLRILPLVCWALAGASLQAQEAAAPERIQGANVTGERMSVPVRIGDAGPYRFIVDTGSQNSVLAGTLAAELGIPAHSTARIVSMAGVGSAPLARVPELRLGKRSYKDLTVALLDQRDIGAFGIIGIDGLQRQRLLIDFTRNSFEVGDARTLGGNRGYEIVVTAQRRQGQLIIADGMLDGVRTAIVIDTGSDTSIGNLALQAAIRRRQTLERVVLLSATGDRMTAEVDLARKLDIERISITNLRVAYADSPVFAAIGLDRKPALLLGTRELRLFRRIALDFAARKIYFDTPDTR